MTVLPSLRQAFRALDPDIPLANPQTGEELIRASLMLPSILGILFTGFGLLGLLLASFGLYGLMSFVVGQRTKEIGIRMALGGQIRNVVGEIVWRGLVLTSFGLGIGVLVAVALGRAIASQLYGVSASDPLVMAISALVLGLVAMLATLIPALRAARINPVVALRNE
jgi:ABC-type antimicrobial peptide transport system permease subunit